MLAPRAPAARAGDLAPALACSSHGDVPDRFPEDDWRRRSRPIRPGGVYPAKEHCSRCGLCDTYYVAHVKEACAFLGDGMSKIDRLEEEVHGRKRDKANDDELHFGVYKDMMYAKNRPPVKGAQWTGIVTQIAIDMLRSKKVDAVVCVQSDENDRLLPKPMVAFTVEDILASKGVKPCLSPNLNVLATVEALNVKRLLFIGVGCQVQALRSIEQYLNLEALYVLGTNCVDNGTREGLDTFVKTASTDPDTVLHYEFMQDYRVHIKHTDGHFEYVPFFSLPSKKLNGVIAQSCYSCFDYPNYLADLVVGYMGVPYKDSNMTSHPQYLTVRNARGAEMLDLVRPKLTITPTESSGDRRPFVMQTLISDDDAKLGEAPDPMPRWLGTILAWVLGLLPAGPKGLEFAKYSLDYHYLRNYLYVGRNWGREAGRRHVPEYAQDIVGQYDRKEIADRVARRDADYTGVS
eukprot:evm.model.scf_41.5 EVM.evm.TU.scf_41.5   scf_41:174089-180627(-)